ncbi:hypothetical protein KIW84_046512 [Lathyrus oleraceus]|uniref:MULE transposase domain-containing protein n=1 Tax=Pisum sativum TaxID=3888 RepID=A0A9D4XP79_PEA|nr:hypothetical protein KIW84_046512 [Pisum sativum]
MENLSQICVDITDAFITTERFGTREEVIRWIKEVEIDNKVTVIISRSDTETGKRGRSNKLIFGCDKGGKHKSTDSGHSFIGRLTTDEKQHVADLTKRHVSPRYILLSLQDRDPENVTRITQVYKHKSVIQKDIRGPRNREFLLGIGETKRVVCEERHVSTSALTDRDLALMKAIEIVFPRSINLLCGFHINKNVGAKCKQHVVNDLQKTIDTLWMEVVWASDEVEYGQRLHQLEQACVDYSGFINYVKDTWLTPHRHRFVGL